jgi:hypothetical protein
MSTDDKRGQVRQIRRAAGVPDDVPREPGPGDSAAVEWGELLPLGGPRALTAFPLPTLPAWGRSMVAGVAEETQTPEDLAAVVYLGSLAAAAGGRAVVDVQSGWTEPVNLYAAVAMEPGSRKSAVFRAMTAPVLDAERDLQATASADRQEREAALKIAEGAAGRAIEEAGRRQAEADHMKDEPTRKRAEEAKAEAIAAKQMIDSIKVPAAPRMIADDATPEALASLLAEQGGQIAAMSAEGDLFDIMSGRYSRDGQASNLGVFLKGHAGDLLLIDRKGREPERIEHPALTITLCIQPSVLRDIAGRPALRGRGLLARVLYSLPRDIVGYRKVNPDLMPGHVKDGYARDLKALALTMAEWTTPAVLMLTPAAREILAAYQERIEPRLRAAEGDLASIRDWASKLAGAVVRIAGLLHLAEHIKDGYARPIDAGTMERAILIGDYFTDHALAAFARMGADPLSDKAAAVLAWIRRSQVGEFTRRDLFDGIRGTVFTKAEDVDEPLELLIDHGYIQLIDRPATTKRGGRPPSPRYAVHPGAMLWPTQPAQPAQLP